MTQEPGRIFAQQNQAGKWRIMQSTPHGAIL